MILVFSTGQCIIPSKSKVFQVHCVPAMMFSCSTQAWLTFLRASPVLQLPPMLLSSLNPRSPVPKNGGSFPKIMHMLFNVLFNTFQISFAFISNSKWTVSAPSMDLTCDILNQGTVLKLFCNISVSFSEPFVSIENNYY